MTSIVHQDIKDIRGQLILKSGSDVIEWSKKNIFSTDHQKKKTKFKEAAFFVDDCESIFSLEPYKRVLENWTPNFREWLGEIWAPSVLFEELRLLKTFDVYSYQHVLVVSVVGARLLEIWIAATPTVKRSFMALVFHRLGKTRWMSGLAQKSEELDQIERQIILEQPLISFVLNAHYWGDANHLCAKVALQQHEDRLGKGYPLRVKTNSLILDVLRMLDRFDAMISSRPFRYQKLSPRAALDVINQDAQDGKMEADVLRAFTDLIRNEKIKDYKKLKLGKIGRPE